MRETRAQQITRILEAAIATDGAPERHAAYDVLKRQLPSGVSPAVVTRFWAEQMRFAAVYHRARRVTDEYAPAVLAGLRAWRSPASDFLARAVGDAQTAEALHAANDALRSLHPVAPFTPKGRRTILSVLAHPRERAAVQAVVTAHGWEGDARQFMLALVYDGSEASVAALRPWLRATAKAGGAARVDLMRYARFAETLEMKELFAQL